MANTGQPDHTTKASDNASPAEISPARTAPLQSDRMRYRHLLRHPVWILRGLIELARARIALRSLRASDIAAFNTQSAQAERETAPDAERIAARVALIIPLLARFVPWRSDCVVQAIGARRWLAAYGLSSTIHVGFDRSEESIFEAHAWLVYDGAVVTGGEIERFRSLMGHEGAARD